MFEKLRAFFSPVGGLIGMGNVLNDVEALLSHFEGDYAKDGNVRNAAIDTLIELLQSEKTK